MVSFCIAVAHSVTFTFTNKCRYTIWPGTLTGRDAQLSSTGFELASKASLSLDAPASWSGRFWARAFCSVNASGKFTCQSGDCSSGQISCNGAGGIPPATLVELTLAGYKGKDFYDISLVDGFNLPVSVTPVGGSDNCNATACPVDVNADCPAELALKNSDGATVGCKSACLAFNQSRYCCTGAFGSPDTCPPTDYSKYMKGKCPQAYSYAYDDKTSTFTCSGGPNYVITFCP
ncbi:thaumatin-like protein 1 [Cornus florida]|uniref:thaumatin-like protein 1 n=1 Tax=Cornus florida TaxID=4283 RepID=UPI00289824E3|nr:thaumatin-like protein 1 [Cornus florida]